MSKEWSFKPWALACAFILLSGLAHAQVEVNTADQPALDRIEGIGPAISRVILAERKRAGNFRDWADFETRVHGVGERRALALSQAGLTVNGKSMSNAPSSFPPPRGRAR